MVLARSFFTPQEQDMLEEAIRSAERSTSAEIVLHLDNFCFGNALQQAKKRFALLGMHKTTDRNGVLIYLATFNRKIALFGDEGIHQKLGSNYWEEKVESLIREFKAERKAEALKNLILDLGSQLGQYFPLKADDRNELDNRISFRK